MAPSTPDADAPGSTPPVLADTAWHLAGEAGSFLRFESDSSDSGTLSAGVGCNTLGAAYTRNGSRFTVGPVRSTHRACPPPLDAAERELAAALRDVRGVEREGDRLLLVDEAGETLLAFRRGALPRP